MDFRIDEDMKIAVIDGGLMSIMGTNEFAVYYVLDCLRDKPKEPVTVHTTDLAKYSGLTMGQLIRAIKNLELKWGLVRDRKIDIGVVTFHF